MATLSSSYFHTIVSKIDRVKTKDFADEICIQITKENKVKDPDSYTDIEILKENIDLFIECFIIALVEGSEETFIESLPTIKEVWYAVFKDYKNRLSLVNRIGITGDKILRDIYKSITSPQSTISIGNIIKTLQREIDMAPYRLNIFKPQRVISESAHLSSEPSGFYTSFIPYSFDINN